MKNEIIDGYIITGAAATKKRAAIEEAAELGMEWMRISNARPTLLPRKKAEKELREYVTRNMTTEPPQGIIPTIVWYFALRAIINYVVAKIMKRLWG